MIDKYIVDFYCHTARLVIEVDGGHHDEENITQRDQERTELLNSLGLKVLRFSNYEIDNRFFDVCLMIEEKVESLLPSGYDRE